MFKITDNTKNNTKLSKRKWNSKTNQIKTKQNKKKKEKKKQQNYNQTLQHH